MPRTSAVLGRKMPALLSPRAPDEYSGAVQAVAPNPWGLQVKTPGRGVRAGPSRLYKTPGRAVQAAAP